MEHDSTVYVGLDVHKESITVAYAIDTGEVELLGKIGTTKTDIDRLCKRLQSKARHVRVVYEAGPCGYGLYRQLVEKGFDCMVCAPSLIPKKARRARQDGPARRDQAGAFAARRRPVSGVRAQCGGRSVPRSGPRMGQRQGRSETARQRLKAFLLSHGVRLYRPSRLGARASALAERVCVRERWQQLAFEEHRRTIEDRLAQCDRLEAALREAVVNWRFYPAVLGLQTMRGVQFTTAVGMLAELGDLSRFEHPRQLMAWLGVTPSEHSSGEKAPSGQHHQERQQLCKKAARGSGLELPAPGTRESRDPAPT